MATVHTTSVNFQTKPSNTTPPTSSPLSSASHTPANSSPTSPRSHGPQQKAAMPPQPHPATRQLCPPKSPLYIPAALRPTQRPQQQQVRFSPPTPPRSQHSSSSSLSGHEGGSGTVSPPHLGLLTHAATMPTPPKSMSLHRHRSSISSTHSRPSGLARDGRSGDDPTSPLTPSASAPALPHPTRAHWKPDAQAPHCDDARCGPASPPFSLLRRRHHCRRCGGVFCADHSAFRAPLDRDAEFDFAGEGVRSGVWRVCEACAALGERKLWGTEGVADEGFRPAAPVAAKGAGGERKADEAAVVMGSSVPKDWSWSTF